MLYAWYPLLVRHAADGTDTTLMTVLLTAFCLAFVRITSAGRAAVAGAWLGLSALTRAMSLPIAGVAAAILLVQRRRAAAASMALAALVVYSPYAVRNYALNGSVLPTRSGINFWFSNTSHTASLVPAYHVELLGQRAGTILESRGLGEVPASPTVQRQQDRVLFSEAWSEIRRDPAATLRLRARNILYFFWPRLVPYRGSDANVTLRTAPTGELTVENSLPRSWIDEAAYSGSYVPVLALAALGVYRRRRELHRDAPLWAVLLTFVTVHSVYFATTRFRAAVEFVLLIYAAVQLDALIGRPPERSP
jgi:hypothetical protein